MTLSVLLQLIGTFNSNSTVFVSSKIFLYQCVCLFLATISWLVVSLYEHFHKTIISNFLEGYLCICSDYV